MAARIGVVLVYGVRLDADQARRVDQAAREDLERLSADEDEDEDDREHETPARALKDAGWSERFEMRAEGWHPGHSDPQWYHDRDAGELGAYAAGFEVDIPRGRSAAEMIAKGLSREDEQEWEEAMGPLLRELGLPSEAGFIAIAQTL